MDFERSLDKLQDVAMRFDQFTTIKEYLLMANRNEYLLKKKKKTLKIVRRELQVAAKSGSLSALMDFIKNWRCLH
jgi:hypothetical protein